MIYGLKQKLRVQRFPLARGRLKRTGNEGYQVIMSWSELLVKGKEREERKEVSNWAKAWPSFHICTVQCFSNEFGLVHWKHFVARCKFFDLSCHFEVRNVRSKRIRRCEAEEFLERFNRRCELPESFQTSRLDLKCEAIENEGQAWSEL